MKNILKKIINYLIFTSIALTLLFLAFHKIDMNKMFDALKNDVNYYWVLFSLVFSFSGFIIRAARWKLLIEPLGYRPSNVNLVNAVIVGYFANIAIPRFGEITRCGALNKTDKIPVDPLIGTVIIERIIDVFSLIILIAVIIITKMKFFGTFFKEKVFIPIYSDTNKIFLSLNFWFFILIIIAIIFALFFIFKNNIRKLTAFHKISDFIKGIVSGFRTFITMKKRGKFLILTLMMWFAYLMSTYLVFFSILPTSNLSLLDGLFILIAGSLGMTAPVQGGFGAYHWMVSLGLMLYGINQATGLLYATLCHESQILLIIVSGIISLSIIFARKRNNSKIVSSIN